nr:isopiperitenol-dehydrogenase [Schizonepeta tenuifolia]
MANTNLNKLQGKIAIVTGGASGIGEATARLFASLGARAVVIADIQPELGRSVAESIGPERCSYVQCDVSDEEQVKSMVEWTAATYGGVDIMFSNAGTMAGSAQTVMELDMSQLDRVMRVNAGGAAACVKHAARKMVELGRRGVIVCSGSVTSAKGAFNLTDYVMSKHAVLGLVRSASMQLGAHGIRVNCVSPAAVPTRLAVKVGLRTADDVESTFGHFTCLKRVVLTAEHIAEAVAFLASDEAAFVTGLDLVVDGGLLSLPFMKPSN